MIFKRKSKTEDADITPEELNMMDESMRNLKEGNLSDPINLEFDDMEDEKLYLLAKERMRNFDPSKTIPQSEVDKMFGFDPEPSDDDIEIN